MPDASRRRGRVQGTRATAARTAPDPYALPARDGLTDVAGLRVGHATNLEAATGCTVVLCPPAGAVAACAVLGGAPGTRETDVLTPGNLVERVHAVLLTGGSAFGLDAAGGVMQFLEQKQIGFKTAAARVPIVAGAVIYDLAAGPVGRAACCCRRSCSGAGGAIG